MQMRNSSQVKRQMVHDENVIALLTGILGAQHSRSLQLAATQLLAALCTTEDAQQIAVRPLTSCECVCCHACDLAGAQIQRKALGRHEVLCAPGTRSMCPW
jgi:hypothetical protein